MGQTLRMMTYPLLLLLILLVVSYDLDILACCVGRGGRDDGIDVHCIDKELMLDDPPVLVEHAGELGVVVLVSVVEDPKDDFLFINEEDSRVNFMESGTRSR